MQKVDFDLNTAATATVQSHDLAAAERVLQQHQSLLQGAGIIGTWIGAQASQPYIMVAVLQAYGEELGRTLPDSIEGIRVYYLEGTPTG